MVVVNLVVETEYLELFDGEVLEKEDVIENLKSKYDNAYYNGLTKITDFTPGSEAYHLLDTIASLFLEAREEINDNYLMSMIHTQEGEFLDNTGDSLGVYRKSAAASSGYVIIYYNPDSALTADAILNEGAGTVCELDETVYLNDLTVLTDDSISFIVEDTSSTLNGRKYLMLEAVCEYEGEYTNVLEDTITIIENDLPAGVRVTNTAFTEGRDIESDDEFRVRILESPSSSPVGSINWFKTIPFIEDGVGDLIHDILPTKQGLSVDEDIRLIYNPIDKDEVPREYTSGQTSIPGTYTPSEYALRQFFALDEYNIVGISLGYDKATVQYVLADTTATIDGTTYDINYVVYTNLNTEEYPEATVETVTPKVEEIINQFNLDAITSEAFNPSTLCVLIEEIPEVADALIYQKATAGQTVIWGLVSEEISMDYDEVYQVSPDVTVITTGPATGLVTVPTKSDNP